MIYFIFRNEENTDLKNASALQNTIVLFKNVFTKS